MTDDQRVWIRERADPYVYRQTDGTYYFTASVPAYDRIVLRRANELAALADAPETVVWRRHASGPMSCHIWAPELHRIDGKWYLYFSAGHSEDIWRIRPYVLVCEGDDPLTCRWRELGPLRSAEEDAFSFRAFSLDATVFAHRGRRYCVWAEKVGVGRQISNLYIAEMAAPDRMKTAQVMLSTPDYAWERVGFWVNEGPAFVRHGERVFLTYSASDTGTAYCVGMLSANGDANLLDPASWTKSRVPVLAGSEALGVYGPGHNTFTTDASGNDIMVFHARTAPETGGNPLYDSGRHAMLLRVRWSAAGEPVFSLNDRP